MRRGLPGSPSAVYTRGFIRNYAQYLGLDPEWCRSVPPGGPSDRESPTGHYRSDGQVRRAEGHNRHHHRAPRARWSAASGARVPPVLGYQFLTFAGTLELTVTDPASDLAAYAGTSYVLRGETVPDAQITVDGLRENPTATASANGILDPGRALPRLERHHPRRHRPAHRAPIEPGASHDHGQPRHGYTLPGGAPNLSSPRPMRSSPVASPSPGPSRPEPRSRSALIAPTPGFEILNLAGQPVAVPPWSPSAPEPVSVSADLAGAFSVPLSLGSAPGSSGSARRRPPPRLRPPAPPRRSRPSAA